MTLPTGEFIRRFLTHVLPKGLHRIRHYGLFANGNRAANIARARELLAVPCRAKPVESPRPPPLTNPACYPVHAAAAAAA
jgi:Putative transposase.